MTTDRNLAIAQQLLAAIGNRQAPETIAYLFSDDVTVEFPGDEGALPWIGRRTGRAAIVDFIIASRNLITREVFTVDDILASETRAAIFGELRSRVVATGGLIQSPFVIVLTVADGAISHFLMLEDSLAVSRASRP